MVIWGRSESCNSDKNEIKRDVINLIFLLFYFFYRGALELPYFFHNWDHYYRP